MIDPRVLLLVAGCLLSGGIIIAELRADDADPATAASPAGRSEALAVEPGRPMRVEAALAVILARPLFSPSRHPPDAGQGSAAARDPSGERLSGIVTEADRRLAIFAVAGAKPLTLGEGDTVGGWRIDRIAPSEVSVSGPGGVQTLRPKPDPDALRQPRPPALAKASEVAARPEPRVSAAPARPGATLQPAGVVPVTRGTQPSRRRGE